MSHKMSVTAFWSVLALLAVLLAACGTPTTATPALSPTATRTPLPTATPTATPTSTPVPQPSVKHLQFATTQDMAVPRQSGSTLQAGPAALYVSFDYADIPSDTRIELRLERDGLVVLDTDEAWEQGAAGTAVVLISDDSRVLVSDAYDLSLTLAEQTLKGRFSISATRGEPGARLIVDSFDDNLLGWYEADNSRYAVKIQDGRLTVSEFQAGFYYWASPVSEFEDFDLSVDAWQEEGPADGYYGVVFRATDTGHYIFSVSADGFLDVGVVTDDAYRELVSRRRHDAIQRGGAVNRLRMVGQGSNFAFYVNDVRVAAVTDKTLRRGTFGLVSGNYDAAGMVSSFDNLVMTLPLEAVEVVSTPTLPAGPRPATVPAATPAPRTPALLATVQETLNHVHLIGGSMDRIYDRGEPEACAPLLTDYFAVVNAPTFDVSGQPSNVQGAYGLYREAIAIIADKISKIRDICESGGGVIGDLDFSVARMAINDAGDRLGTALGMLP